MLSPASIGAIGAIGSGFLDAFGQHSANQANRDIANATNAANINIAREQMKFQENMSSTSWQRGVEDMRKAGINPMLAVSQGGASSPAGAAVGAVTGAPVQNKFARAQDAYNSAMQARLNSANLDQIRWQTRKTMSDMDLNNVMKVNQLADATLKENNARVAANNAKIAAQTLSQMKLARPGLEVESNIDKSKFGQIARALQRYNPFGHSAASLIKAVK